MGNISYIEQFEKWQEAFSFYQPIKVRFSETDMFGHLNNTVPFTYFEEARIAFLQYKGLMEDWVNKNSITIPVVADLQCDFLTQVFFDEHLKVYVKIAKIGTSSIDLHYMAKKKDNRPCFVGRGAMVQISRETGKGVPWSSTTKAKLME